MNATNVAQNSHYHIVWKMAGTQQIDYLPFENIEAAAKTAEKLLRVGETFQIKEYPDGCDFDCPVWNKWPRKPS